MPLLKGGCLQKCRRLPPVQLLIRVQKNRLCRQYESLSFKIVKQCIKLLRVACSFVEFSLASALCLRDLRFRGHRIQPRVSQRCKGGLKKQRCPGEWFKIDQWFRAALRK